jgi:hypothetical protein
MSVVVRPNLGFSVDINDSRGFFNFGVEGQFSLMDMFIARLSTGLCEAVWTHQLTLVLNVKAFELGISGALRSESFAGSFSGNGFSVNLGLRFGW